MGSWSKGRVRVSTGTGWYHWYNNQWMSSGLLRGSVRLLPSNLPGYMMQKSGNAPILTKDLRAVGLVCGSYDRVGLL